MTTLPPTLQGALQGTPAPMGLEEAGQGLGRDKAARDSGEPKGLIFSKNLHHTLHANEIPKAKTKNVFPGRNYT